MSRTLFLLPAVSGLFVLFLCCAGCLSTSVGDTRYDNGSVIVQVGNTGEPADVSVQVTIYRIANLTQEKYTVVSAPATLTREENEIVIPARLEKGSYKLYVYVLGDGDRKTAVIRDIVV
jgi:hypothetical protein